MDIEGTMRKLLVFIGMVAFLFGYTSNVSLARQDFITMDNGLRYMDVETGSGAIAETGMIVVVHLIGWLDNNGAKGSKFISTYNRGKPVSFKLGTDKVMKAWSEGGAMEFGVVDVYDAAFLAKFDRCVSHESMKHVDDQELAYYAVCYPGARLLEYVHENISMRRTQTLFTADFCDELRWDRHVHDEPEQPSLEFSRKMERK